LFFFFFFFEEMVARSLNQLAFYQDYTILLLLSNKKISGERSS